MVNALTLMRIAGGALAAHPSLAVEGDNATSVVDPDPSRRFYFGNSQGGIFGGVYMESECDRERGVTTTAKTRRALLQLRARAGRRKRRRRRSASSSSAIY